MTKIKEILKKLFNIVKKILGLNSIVVAEETIEKKVPTTQRKSTRRRKKRQSSACKKTRTRTNKRYTNARVDSINLNSNILTSHFFYDDKYVIDTIKVGNRCDNYVWRKAFGKSLHNKLANGKWISPYTEAHIVNSHLGCILPMKIHNRNKGVPTIEFAGLERYDERSKLLKMTLQDLVPLLQDAKIKRLDICIDVEKRVQSKVHSSLRKKRVAKRKKNITYYHTCEGEFQRNQYIDISVYNKGQKEGLKLDYKLFRIEFSFGSLYLKNTRLRDIDALIKKIEKTISKFTSLNIKVSLPF